MSMRSSRIVLLALLFAGVCFQASAQTATGPEFRVNAETEGHQMHPQVAMNALGDFVVVWGRRESEGDEFSLHARRFAADGTPETGEILVREDAGDSVETAVAMMEDGSFVVVYAGRSETGSGRIASLLEGRRFAADGAPLGEPFAIGTRREAQDPVVAARPDGGFVVAWEARREEAWDREGRRLNVSNNSTRPLSGIRIAKDRSGSFFVVWAALGDGLDIFRREFRPSGVRRRQVSRVNTIRPGDQRAPAVADDGDGNFVVVWESEEPDGSGSDVFARLFRRRR